MNFSYNIRVQPMGKSETPVPPKYNRNTGDYSGKIGKYSGNRGEHSENTGKYE
jgi:hypothetical protein